MHPADEIRGVKSKKLSGKRIVLGVTGSIATVESIRVARELIRHGAEVISIMTKAATRIIHPDALEFATGTKPIIELTGKTEHVALCGLVTNPVDLLLISPCTANTISKIAYGIDDSTVTTFASTAIGAKVPILIVPAMHMSMYQHKILQKNIELCKSEGISFIGPELRGNKAKMADQSEIIASVIRRIGKDDFAKKKILIIGGATAEPVDDIRILTNRSSGKTAVALAKSAFERGAGVEVWYGVSKVSVPSYISVKHFESVQDLQQLMKAQNLKPFDMIIVCAAIGDYLPTKQTGKILSGKEKLSLDLIPAPKLIRNLRSMAPSSRLIGFKVEQKKTMVQQKALELLKKNTLDFVVANTIEAFTKDENEIWVFDKKEKMYYKQGSKEELADAILDIIK